MTPASTTDHGASPIVLALLASGGFISLSAVLFLSPFVLSPYAMQNDVYMGNLFLSPPWFLLGAILFLAGLLIARLQGRGAPWKQGLLLAGIGGVLLALLYLLVGGHYSSVGPPSTWPPYLNETMMGVTLALAVGEFIVGWGWGALARSRRRQQTPAGT
jgi:hypothetical protein